jgi:hypothetical protein
MAWATPYYATVFGLPRKALTARDPIGRRPQSPAVRPARKAHEVRGQLQQSVRAGPL